MTDPEKKKRLEDIRRKRRELQEQLNQSEAKKLKNNRNVEQEAIEALKSATRPKVQIESLGVVEHAADVVSRYIKSKKSQDYKTVNFTEEFPAYKPELYDEGTQWYDEKNYEEEESDNEEKEQIQAKPREQLVFLKNKQVKTEESKLVEKKYEVIPEEQREQYLKNYQEEINEFLRAKKKHMERAIKERELFNIFENDDYKYPISLPDSNELVHPLVEFYDESCDKRTVTSLEWSLKYPELLLSCYSRRTDEFTANQKNGLIYIWSLAIKKVPEFTFTCQPEITSAIFHPYNPKLIIGGTHTGQVMIWDTRGKQTAVYKTPLGLGGGQSGVKTHTSDITCLGVIGSTNSSHIISLSNGAICLWSLNNLSSPVKRIELKAPQQKKENDDLSEMSILSMGMQQYDTNNLLIGSDDNNVYQISLNEDNSRNVILNTFKGHDGSVYSVDFHPSDYFNTCNFSHLFATSSADWTTKIWSKQNTLAPLFTIESSNNYVYSSKWSPTNASILAIGDGNGYLDIMDLNKDMESPRIHCKLGKEALSKICWTEDGKRITVGDSAGKVQLFALDKQIYSSTSEDSKKFEKLIGKMK
jgi:dynein intermediate chain